jgi:CCCH-type zinc finger
MLANIHATEFESFLNSIIKDIALRLDESPVGMPSATRLRKTIRDGFDGFKNHLPSRALPELYYGANATPGAHRHSTSAQSSAFSRANSSQNISGFASSTPSPFDRPPLTTATQTQSSFASSTNDALGSGPFSQPKSSPFGIASTTPSPFPASPFGTTQPVEAPFEKAASVSNSSPFGNNTTSLFGGAVASNSNQIQASSSSTLFGNPQPAQNPFAGGASAQSPFASSSQQPFGTQNQPSPFAAQQSNPFVSQQSNPFGSQQSSPFGSQQSNPFGSQQSNPFGSQQQSTTTGSGLFGSQQQPNPFGTQQSSPFGAQQQSTPFGGDNQRPMCKYFARGQCRFGDKCRSSHEMPSNSSSGPFGGPRR